MEKGQITLVRYPEECWGKDCYPEPDPCEPCYPCRRKPQWPNWEHEIWEPEGAWDER